MPISKENRGLYPPPKRWRAIRASILQRANDCCERCGRENGDVHCVAGDGSWCCVGGDRWTSPAGRPTRMEKDPPSFHLTKTVLTIAHLDHDPTNSDPSNLMALCQRCHLLHDGKQHASSARRTRARRAGQLEIPGVSQ